jgi:nucleotide-binding universal stress UspA family protein
MKDENTVIAVLEQQRTDELVAREAERLAKIAGGKVVLLDTLPLVELSIRGDGDGRRIEPWEQMRAHKAFSRRRLAELRRSLDVPTDVAIQFGDPVETVASEAARRQPLLVVVASPNKSRFGRRRLDRALVRSLNVPVAVVGEHMKDVNAN